MIWYFSGMNRSLTIPAIGLLGEDDAPVTAVHCELISHRAGYYSWQIVPHRHDHLVQVIALQHGQAEAEIDGSQLRFGASEFLYVPAQTVHSFRFVPDTEGIVLTCPTALVSAFGPARDQISPVLSSVFSGPMPDALLALLRGLAQTDNGAAFKDQSATGLALFVLATLAGHAAGADPGTAQAPRHPALAQFDAQIAQDVTAGRAARRSARHHAADLGLSTGHLSRICRAQTGRGAAAYLETRVMQEACRLLAFTDCGVAQVGYALGYADPSYFTRRFTQHCGQTPTQYRAQCFRQNQAGADH